MAARRRTPSSADSDIQTADMQAKIETLQAALESRKPSAKWAAIGTLLISLAGAPTVLEVVRAWRAEPPKPDPIVQIDKTADKEWKDRLESKVDRLIEADIAEKKLRDDQISEIRYTLKRLLPPGSAGLSEER